MDVCSCLRLQRTAAKLACVPFSEHRRISVSAVALTVAQLPLFVRAAAWCVAFVPEEFLPISPDVLLALLALVAPPFGRLAAELSVD